MDLSTFVENLAEAETDLLTSVWPDGRNPSIDWDGGHFALRDYPERPLSVSRVEARCLGLLVELLDAGTVIEIGTGFGYSTAWIAWGLSRCSAPIAVHTIDNRTEGGVVDRGAHVAESIWTTAGVRHLIQPHRGNSPEAVSALAIGEADLVFIDGDHFGDQPLRDYQAVLPKISRHGCIVFHDVQSKYTVARAVQKAASDGFICLPLETSCEMLVASRSERSIHAGEFALSLAKRIAQVGNAHV